MTGALNLKNRELTTREKELIGHWRRHIEQTGVAPNKNWLSKQLGVSRSAMPHLLGSLQKKGYLHEKKTITKRLTLSAKARREVP